ncbi:MAG: histidine phosphatase family protein [Anaerolineae bacterium]|nr:histidine phosphatase family protein [Anaerolineae bacterium]
MNEQVVYLIRHGTPLHPVDQQGRQLVYGPTAGLTEKGVAQCKRLAHRIMEREGSALAVLLASPYARTQQTAKILAGEMNVRMVMTDDRLRDTRSTWEGVLLDDFLTVFSEGKAFDDPHTLETLDDLGERMKAAYDAIVARFDGKSIGIVSHGDPIRALCFRLYNPQVHYPPYLELTKMISLSPAEGIRIQSGPDGRQGPDIEIISGA